jgi:hypothetical protein
MQFRLERNGKGKRTEKKKSIRLSLVDRTVQRICTNLKHLSLADRTVQRIYTNLKQTIEGKFENFFRNDI